MTSKQREWTEGRALVFAAAAASATALILAGVTWYCADRAPLLVQTRFVQIFYWFGMAWILFSVLHGVSSMVSDLFSVAVALLCFALMTVQQYALLHTDRNTDLFRNNTPTSLEFFDILFTNIWGVGAVVAAIIFCREGDRDLAVLVKKD
jgi:hypothetical protein